MAEKSTRDPDLLKPGSYFIFPKEFIGNMANLSGNAVKIYALFMSMRNWGNNQKRVWPATEYICKVTGIKSKTTVTSAVKELIEAGWIDYVHKRGWDKPNEYLVNSKSCVNDDLVNRRNKRQETMSTKMIESEKSKAYQERRKLEREKRISGSNNELPNVQNLNLCSSNNELMKVQEMNLGSSNNVLYALQILKGNNSNCNNSKDNNNTDNDSTENETLKKNINHLRGFLNPESQKTDEEIKQIIDSCPASDLTPEELEDKKRQKDLIKEALREKSIEKYGYDKYQIDEEIGLDEEEIWKEII